MSERHTSALLKEELEAVRLHLERALQLMDCAQTGKFTVSSERVMLPLSADQFGIRAFDEIAEGVTLTVSLTGAHRDLTGERLAKELRATSSAAALPDP